MDMQISRYTIYMDDKWLSLEETGDGVLLTVGYDKITELRLPISEGQFDTLLRFFEKGAKFLKVSRSGVRKDD